MFGIKANRNGRINAIYLIKNKICGRHGQDKTKIKKNQFNKNQPKMFEQVKKMQW